MRGARRCGVVIVAAASAATTFLGSGFLGGGFLGATPASAAAAPADVITTVAGGGVAAFSTNAVSARAAALGQPLAAAVDASGNIVVADQNDNVIRVVADSTGTFYGQAMTRGDIYTIAGTGEANYTGDGGPARSATLWGPCGVAVDAAGDIAITDTGNSVVRFIPKSTGVAFGLFMTAGNIYDIAGNGLSSGYSGDGGQATTAELSSPDGIAFDPKGNLLVADTGNNVIRLVGQHAGTDLGISVTPGDIYTVVGNSNFGYSGDGGPAVDATLSLESFSGLATDARGDLILADGGNSVVRMVAAFSGFYGSTAVTAGDIYTIIGNSIEGYRGNRRNARTAELDTPQGVAVDSSGDILVADSANNVVRLVAASNGRPFDVAAKAGDIYGLAGNAATGFSGDGKRPTLAELNSPSAVAVGPSGDVVIVDNGNNVIREIAPPPPVVVALAPSSGPSTGGTRVTVLGRDLTGATSVLFGSKAALGVSVVSSKKIVVTAPAGTGNVTVTVSTASGQSAAAPGATFSYQG